MELLQLPDVVLHRILSLLGPLDLLQLSSLSKAWFLRIRNDDSLWIPHLKTYSYGIWNEIVDDVDILGDVRISDWFVYYGQRLKANERLEIQEISVGKETWIRQLDRDLAFETAILTRSFQIHEDSLTPIGILVRRYLYKLQLFRRKNPYINFLEPLPEDVKSDLELLGQARDRDLLARRHKNLQSTYVCLRKALHDIDFGSCDRISEFFPVVNGHCLEPLFACRVSSVSSTGDYTVCQSSARLAEKYQEFASCRFDTFFNTRGHEGLLEFCKLLRSDRQLDTFRLFHGSRTTPQRKPGTDVFVAKCRRRVRDRMNRIIHYRLVPKNSQAKDVCRVDLSDAQELGGDNPKQEMISSIVVSDSAVLLVMQLVGRNRF